eukprot:m.93501 g.93501  ORF g.93501 m.93501 type:complete len:327 (-) comp8912_c0_seq1:138-1118(-)
MSHQRVETLKLTPAQRKKLEEKGFSMLSDFDGLTVPDLKEELQVSMQEAAQILEVVRNAQCGTSPVWVPLSEETQARTITTLVESFDDLLNGGIETKRVTEICGAPGAGKTQFSIQMVVNCQLPLDKGGLDCSAVYIDTEGSFMAERMKHMAESVVEDNCQQQQDNGTKKQSQIRTVDEMLERVHVFRVHNHIELIAVVNTLAAYCHDHPDIKLIIVDSIAFHFRNEFGKAGMRNRMLNGIAQKLMSLATRHDLAVLITNQMTTKINKVTGSNVLVPALGESWAHACTTRVVLNFSGTERTATLVKSPSLPERSITYSIDQRGIRA